jgi:hypothetical protein
MCRCPKPNTKTSQAKASIAIVFFVEVEPQVAHGSPLAILPNRRQVEPKKG